MTSLGLAVPAAEVLAALPAAGRALAAQAEERGLGSLWLLAAGREESPALPLTAAAIGAGRRRLRLGLGLSLYDDPVRVAEDLCVLDNLLEGRLDVAFTCRRQPGGGTAWAELARVGALCDLLAGEPAGPARGRARVFPRTVQRPLVPAVWLGADASVHDVRPVLRAGLGAILPRRLAATLPAAWRSAGGAPLGEVLGSPRELDEPPASGVAARLVLGSLRRPGVVEEIATAGASTGV